MKNKEFLYVAVIDTYGVEKQLDMVVEECSELIKAINKIKRNDCLKYIGLVQPSLTTTTIKQALIYNELCGEVADLEILLEQMRLILRSDQISLIKERKLQRLSERINYKINNKTDKI